jgi:cytochrome c553
MRRVSPLAGALWLVVAGSAGAQDSAVSFADRRLEDGRAVVVGAFGVRVAKGAGGDGVGAACLNCHGLDGAGDDAAVIPRLAGQSPEYLYGSLLAYASGARRNAVMTPVAQALTDTQMRDVSAWYAAQQGAPHSPRAEVEAEALQLGAAVAATGSASSRVQACVNCHGPEGAGLPPSYPYLGGQVARYMEAQLRAWRDGSRAPDAHGVMAGIARRMTEREIVATSAYYAALRPEVVLTALGRGAVAGAGAP